MTYLTKAEVADLLRVSVRTVTSYMSKDLLPVPSCFGRKLLWKEEEVLQALAKSNKIAQAACLSTPRVSRGRPRKVCL